MAQVTEVIDRPVDLMVRTLSHVEQPRSLLVRPFDQGFEEAWSLR